MGRPQHQRRSHPDEYLDRRRTDLVCSRESSNADLRRARGTAAGAAGWESDRPHLWTGPEQQSLLHVRLYFDGWRSKLDESRDYLTVDLQYPAGQLSRRVASFGRDGPGREGVYGLG